MSLLIVALGRWVTATPASSVDSSTGRVGRGSKGAPLDEDSIAREPRPIVTAESARSKGVPRPSPKSSAASQLARHPLDPLALHLAELFALVIGLGADARSPSSSPARRGRARGPTRLRPRRRRRGSRSTSPFAAEAAARREASGGLTWPAGSRTLAANRDAGDARFANLAARSG